MAPTVAESIVGTHPTESHLHRRVVQIGAGASWLVATIFVLLGVFTGNGIHYAQAVGPVLAAGLMTAQILLRKENAAIALVFSALLILVLFPLVGTEDTLVPTAVSLVVISSIGMIFVRRHRSLVVGAVGVLLFALPTLWGGDVEAALLLGAIMALSFVMTSAILLMIHDGATAISMRLQLLFERSPAAVLEEDWSDALAYLRSEYTGRTEKLKAFLHAYPTVVRNAVGKAKIVRINRAAVELLEADTPAQLLGYRRPDKVTDDNLEIFIDGLVALYEGSAQYDQEILTVTMKGRPIWLQLRCVDTSTDGRASTVVIGLADITHVKARHEAMADLVRSKDEFIAKVSHELRTPLTAVVGLTSEITAAAGLSNEERQELMRLVAGQAAEMSYIVDDLLVAARAETGTVSVDPEVIDIVGQLEITLEGLGIRVQEKPSGVRRAVADPNRVRQILRNLLTNAERYGGPNRRVLAGSSSGFVWLEVRDDGDGVPQSKVGEIFEPYGTAHSGVEGSVGLGLSVARQLAELMGGTLTYRRDGDESVFRLELPMAGETDRSLRALASQNF